MVGYRAEGGPRDPLLRVTMTRAANKVAARSRRESRTTGSTGPGRKSPRWSAARRASRSWEREAPHQGACVPVMAREPGCLAGIRCARRRSPSPRPGWKTKTIRRDAPSEKERDEDEVGDRGNEQIVGWVERSETQHPRAGRAMLGLARSARSTQPTAWRYAPGYLTS